MKYYLFNQLTWIYDVPAIYKNIRLTLIAGSMLIHLFIVKENENVAIKKLRKKDKDEQNMN